METQVDIIHRLLKRDMFHVTQDIFDFLEVQSLRSCELVSKSWYFAIRNDNIWKKRYDRETKKRPNFYRSLFLHTQLQIENSEFFYKKLFWAIENDPCQHKLKLPCNRYRRSHYHGRYHIAFLTMNDKRIVVGEDYRFLDSNRREGPKLSIIFVYDSFTLELECGYEVPGAGRIKHLQLQEDLLFGSFYSTNLIYVWDLESKQIVQKVHDDISGQCIDGLYHAAHGLLVSCYNVASGVAFQEDIDGDAHLIVRRIHSPAEMKIENKEHLLLWEINQVESNAKIFAVSLSVGVPESRELQLRSKSDFLVIHRIEMSPDYKFCAFHDGQLLTLAIISNQVQINFWDIRKFSTGVSLTLVRTRLSPITLTQWSRVSIQCGQLIISEVSDISDNLLFVKGVLGVNEIEFHDCSSFVQLRSDNYNNPRIPKLMESWDRLYEPSFLSGFYSDSICTFDNIQFLFVTSYSLTQRILRNF